MQSIVVTRVDTAKKNLKCIEHDADLMPMSEADDAEAVPSRHKLVQHGLTLRQVACNGNTAC